MKVAPLAVLALLATSPLAFAALDALGVGPGFTVEAPDWAPGSTWEWDTTGRGRVVGEGFHIVRVQTDTLRVDATRRAEVLNTTMETDGVPTDLVLEAFRVDQVRHGDDVVYEGAPDEGTPAEASGFAESFFCITPCGTFLATYHDANPHFGAHAFSVFGTDAVQLLDFPLERGKGWSVIMVEEDDLTFEIEAKVIDQEYITLPGRAPVAAIRIEAALTDASKEAVQALVRGEAAKEGLDVHMDLGLTVTYWYAPELQNIVKLDLDGFVTGRGVGYGTAASGRLDFHVDQVLTGVSLQPTRERSLQEAHALVGATSEAGGAAPRTSTRDIAFQVGASELSVPAGSDETVRFGLLTDARQQKADARAHEAFDPAPADTRVVWTHHAPTGTSASAEGADASFALDAPGLHVVRAQVFDLQGRLMGADQILVEAYTHETFVLGADGPFGTPLKQQYHVHDLTVAPGARFAQVTLDPDAVARGVLTITGADGDTQETPVDTIAEPVVVSFHDLGAGRRMVGWADETRAGSLTVTLEVRYERTLDAARGPA